MLDAILAALLPHLLEILGVLLTMLIAWASARFSAWTKIQIEARHREALHSALMTGARIALSRGLSGEKAAALAIGYAETSVPDAMAKLAKGKETALDNLARAKLAEMGG